MIIPEIAQWVYLGMMPIVFVPAVRYWTKNSPARGKIETTDDHFGVAFSALFTMLLWPLLILVAPIAGYAKLVKYVGNYQRRKVQP